VKIAFDVTAKPSDSASRKTIDGKIAVTRIAAEIASHSSGIRSEMSRK
jgi:hypothetical protein